MFSFLGGLFAHPLLAGGALAGGIPIVIHLLNRQRFKKVVWGAMHWLWASFKKSRKRIQIEQLILLAIRVLVLVLLAMALARPVLQEGIGLLTGRSSRHRVIVLDNSYSMGQLIGGKPIFEKARQQAIELAENLSLSDEVDVLLANSVTEELPGSNTKKDVVERLKGAALSDGTTDIPRSIAAACKLINERRSALRNEIIVITDQTREGWEQPDHQPRKVGSDDEVAIAKAFSNLASKPRIFVIRVHGEKDADNFAASGIEVDEKVVPTGAETQLVGKVVSFASTERKNLAVKLKVDGEEVGTEIIPMISPGKEETVTFRHSFSEPGSHAVSIELPGDVLPQDNSAYLALDVENQMKVLCVDGQQRVGPNASEMDFFKQALSPTKSEEIKAGKMPLYPEVIGDSLFPEKNLDEYRLVVLANVGLIPPEKVQALELYVKHGGALWIFLGDRVDPNIYNRDLGNLLPMTLGDLAGSGDSESPGESLSDKDVDHPAISKFRGIKALPLSHLKVFRRFKLVPKAASEGNVRTVLAFENGEPAAVEKFMGEGKGRVLLFGTSANKAWNNFPTKNHYMPLMNFLALDLIQPAYVQRNRLHGERFILQIPHQDLGDARREGIHLVDPGGEASAMEILTDQSIAESSPIRKCGIYTAEIKGETKHVVHFAANRNIEESDLVAIEDKEILSNIPRAGQAPTTTGYFKNIVTQDDLQLLPDDPKVVEESLKKSAGSREIWRWLAAIVLCLLLTESILARRFGDFTR